MDDPKQEPQLIAVPLAEPYQQLQAVQPEPQQAEPVQHIQPDVEIKHVVPENPAEQNQKEQQAQPAQPEKPVQKVQLAEQIQVVEPAPEKPKPDPKIGELKKQIAEVERSIALARQSEWEIYSELAKAKDTFNTQQEANRAAEQQTLKSIQDRKTNLQTLRINKEDAQKKLQSAKSNTQGKKKSSKSAEQFPRLEVDPHVLQSMYESKIQTLRSRLQKLSKDNDELQSKKKGHTDKHVDKKEESPRKDQAKVDEMRGKAYRASAEHQVQREKKETEKMQARMFEQEKQLEKLKKESATFKHSRDKINIEIEEKEKLARNNKLSDRIKAAQKDLARLKPLHAKLMASVDQVQKLDLNKERLIQQLKDIDRDQKNIKTKTESAENELKKITKTVEGDRARLTNLQGQLSLLVKQDKQKEEPEVTKKEPEVKQPNTEQKVQEKVTAKAAPKGLPQASPKAEPKIKPKDQDIISDDSDLQKQEIKSFVKPASSPPKKLQKEVKGKQVKGQPLRDPMPLVEPEQKNSICLNVFLSLLVMVSGVMVAQQFMQ